MTLNVESQYICTLQFFDPESIDAELERLTTDMWVHHVNQNAYSGEWSVLPVRCLKNNEFSHPILQCHQIEQGLDWVNLPVLEVLPEISGLIDQIPFVKKSIRLMKLGSGARIKEHTDSGLNIENGEGRFHIPLQCEKEVDFYSDGKQLSMAPGELWYINADAPHSVINGGTEPRINLVIDCVVSLRQWQGLFNKERQDGTG